MTPLTCSTRRSSILPKLTTRPSAGEIWQCSVFSVWAYSVESARLNQRSLFWSSGSRLEPPHEKVAETGVGLKVVFNFVKVDTEDKAIELESGHTEPYGQRVFVESAVNARESA